MRVCREGDHQRHPRQPGSPPGRARGHQRAGHPRDLLPRRRGRVRPQPARVHRPRHGLQARSAGQPRPGGDVRPGRVQPVRRAGHLLDPRRSSNRRPNRGRAARSGGSSSPNGPAATARTATCSSTARARNPLNEYVFPEDIYNQRKMERIFALVDRYCFQGHTHVPGVFTENHAVPQPGRGRVRVQARRPQDAVQRRLGRPAARRRLARLLRRARQRRDQVPPRRVRLEKTSEKIYDIPDLDNFLGDRLREGR